MNVKKMLLALGAVVIVWVGVIATIGALLRAYHRVHAPSDVVWPYDEGFSGSWIAKKDDSGIELDLRVDGDRHVTGEFSSVYTRPDSGNASFIDSGTVDGTLQKTTAQITWTGDRDDNGTATITYDPTHDSLVWQGIRTHYDGLYSIPLSMTFSREKSSDAKTK